MLLPTIALPTFDLPGLIALLLIVVAGAATVYAVRQRKSNSDFAGIDIGRLVLGLLVAALVLLGIDWLPEMLSSFSLANYTMAEILAVIIATTIPLIAYQLIQLTRVIQWTDVVVFIGLSLLPSAAVLALLNQLTGAAVTGIMGIMTAHALGIIDTD